MTEWNEETRKRLEEIIKQRADPEITDPDEYEYDLGCIAAALEEIERQSKTIDTQSGVISKLLISERQAKQRIEAALEQAETRQTYNPDCSYCREMVDRHARVLKALRDDDICKCCGMHETVCPCVHYPNQTRCEVGGHCVQDDGTPWPTKYGCGGEKCDKCEP